MRFTTATSTDSSAPLTAAHTNEAVKNDMRGGLGCQLSKDPAVPLTIILFSTIVPSTSLGQSTQAAPTGSLQMVESMACPVDAATQMHIVSAEFQSLRPMGIANRRL